MNEGHDISPEDRAALQEKWAAGRSADEAVERKLEEAAESPERARLGERLKEFKNRIRETWQEFFGTKPMEDAALERRYGAGMTDAEKAEDAALMAKGDEERVHAESLLGEVLNFGEARRPAGPTPVHEAYQAHAEARAPEEERVPAEQLATLKEADAAAKALDPKLETGFDEYGGRRVIRFTHADFPDEVSWLMPLEAFTPDEAKEYLASKLHKTYGEKMAKLEASAVELPKKAEAVEETRIVEARPADGKAVRQHETMLAIEADLEARLDLAKEVRDGAFPAEDLNEGQRKWLGALLDDPKELAWQEKRLADLKSRRNEAASELGLPSEAGKASSEPKNIVIGAAEAPEAGVAAGRDGTIVESAPTPVAAEENPRTAIMPQAEAPSETISRESSNESAVRKNPYDKMTLLGLEGQLDSVLEELAADPEDAGLQAKVSAMRESISRRSTSEGLKSEIARAEESLAKERASLETIGSAPDAELLAGRYAQDTFAFGEGREALKGNPKTYELKLAAYAERLTRSFATDPKLREDLARWRAGKTRSAQEMIGRKMAESAELARRLEEAVGKPSDVAREHDVSHIAAPPKNLPLAEAALLGVAGATAGMAMEAMDQERLEREKRAAEAAPVLTGAEKAYLRSWKTLKEAVSDMVKADPQGAVESFRKMHEDAKASRKNEKAVLKGLVDLRLIAAEDAEKVAGTEAMRDLTDMYLLMHEDALREAEKIAEKAPAAAEAPSAPERKAEAVSDHKAGILAEADRLIARRAELVAAGMAHDQYDNRISKLADRLGGMETPEGKALGDYLEAQIALGTDGTPQELEAAREAFLKAPEAKLAPKEERRRGRPPRRDAPPAKPQARPKR